MFINNIGIPTTCNKIKTYHNLAKDLLYIKWEIQFQELTCHSMNILVQHYKHINLMEIHWFLPLEQEDFLCIYIIPKPESKPWQSLRMQITNTDERRSEKGFRSAKEQTSTKWRQ
jgi:hypothetical protein